MASFPSPCLRACRPLMGLMAALAMLASCADLSEITKFASASQKVGDTYTGLAAEAVRSCDRGNMFVTADNPVPPLDCDWYVRMNPSLAAVNKGLFDYIAALGKLSTADTSKEGKGLDSLSDDLKKGDPGISAANLSRGTAVGGLVKSIAEVWASGYRARKLAAIVQRNDAAVKDVTDFLRDYATDAYRQVLQHERAYESSLCLNKQAPRSEPLATYLLNRSCEADALLISQKLAAVKTYQEALATIQATHARLAHDTETWDVKELGKDFGSSAGDLAKAASSIRKSF